MRNRGIFGPQGLIFLTGMILSIILSHGIGCDSTSSEPLPLIPEHVLGLEWIEAFRKDNLIGTAHLKSPPPSSQVITGQDEISIDLGALPWSRSYVFLVTNSGDAPIKNLQIRLAVNKKGFSIEPDSISTVPASSSSSGLPIIRLSVEHGQSEFGLVPRPLLSAGNHSISLELNGLWTDINGEIHIDSLTANITLDAKIVDIELSDAVRTFDLRKPNGMTLWGGFDAGGFSRSFTRTGAVLARNIGNTPVEVDFMLSPTNILVGSLLQPGMTLTIPELYEGFVRIGRGLATRDVTRLPLSPDGYTYFVLSNPD